MWSGESDVRDSLTGLFTTLATWLSSIGRRASYLDVLSDKREMGISFGLHLIQTAFER